jgi:uncharacterized protein (DUF1684 family)
VSNLKCLSLSSWMEESDISWMREETLKHYEPCEAFIGVPGVYRTLGACWFELSDGRAFKYKVGQFDYEIACLHARELNHRQVAALKELIVQRLATKQQKKLHYHAVCAAETRDVWRRARMAFLRFKEEYLDAKAHPQQA